LIFRKIIEIDATRCHNIKAKVHQSIFAGAPAQTRWRSLQRSPKPLADLREPTFWKEGQGRGGGSRGRRGSREKEGGERKGEKRDKWKGGEGKGKGRLRHSCWG